MTVETTATLSAEDARTLVDRVRGHVEDVRGALIRLWSGRAWLALGYATWDDLCDAEFAVRIALPREQRREVVAELRSEGMSTRAIGSALGVHHDTVAEDLNRLSETRQMPETVTSLDGRSRPAHVTTTTRTTETTKVERDVDLETGEIATRTPSKPRTDVVAAVNRICTAARQARFDAERIQAHHLAHRKEEAAAWGRDLSESMQSLQRLLDALMEASK